MRTQLRLYLKLRAPHPRERNLIASNRRGRLAAFSYASDQVQPALSSPGRQNSHAVPEIRQPVASGCLKQVPPKIRQNLLTLRFRKRFEHVARYFGKPPDQLLWVGYPVSPGSEYLNVVEAGGRRGLPGGRGGRRPVHVKNGLQSVRRQLFRERLAHGPLDRPIQSQVTPKLHGQTPAAPQDALLIPQSPVETAQMAERIDAYHYVERLREERQAFGIPENPVNTTAGAGDIGVSHCPPQHPRGNIQADGLGGRAMMLNEPT